MPYLLMTRCYDYDDQFYYEQDGGYAELFFRDDQRDEAFAELERRREAEWPDCTPLDAYYQDQALADLSSSGLDDQTLADGISALLNEPLSSENLLELDFTTRQLTKEQQHGIGLILDLVGRSYLEVVPEWGGS